MLNPEHVRRRFDRVARQFDGADFVHATTRLGLLARIEPLLTEAKTVVDLGAATGTASPLLQKRFKGARIISVDFARRMLERAQEKKRWLSNATFVQARAEALPFANESIDVIFSNQLLPWVNSPATVFSEVARVLCKGGVFAFATLGPDSFREIRHAWRQLDDYPHVNHFPDMHDLGDGLVNAGLRDPVLDVDRLCIDYQAADRLLADLAASGARNALSDRSKALTGKRRFAAMLEGLTAAGGSITLDIELVYGHCWGAGPKMDPANYRIDATRIPLRRS